MGKSLKVDFGFPNRAELSVWYHLPKAQYKDVPVIQVTYFAREPKTDELVAARKIADGLSLTAASPGREPDGALMPLVPGRRAPGKTAAQAT